MANDQYVRPVMRSEPQPETRGTSSTYLGGESLNTNESMTYVGAEQGQSEGTSALPERAGTFVEQLWRVESQVYDQRLQTLRAQEATQSKPMGRLMRLFVVPPPKQTEVTYDQLVNQESVQAGAMFEKGARFWLDVSDGRTPNTWWYAPPTAKKAKQPDHVIGLRAYPHGEIRKRYGTHEYPATPEDIRHLYTATQHYTEAVQPVYNQRAS